MGEPEVGKLIVIEGIDGSGKSTLSKHLKETLEKNGFSVLLTKEPTDGEYGKILRERIKKGNLTPEEELELFIKDREEHVRKEINPALRQGKIVICDRYFISNMAYQGARGLDYREILKKNSGFPLPDLVIFLDISPELALSRKHLLLPHFENTEFLKRVREIYLKVLPLYSHIIIDASLSPKKVAKLAEKEILRVTHEG